MDGLYPRMHQHKTTGAIGVLYHPRRRTQLSKKRSLLITRDPRDRHTKATGNYPAAGAAIYFAGSPYFGQYGFRDIKKTQQVFIPLPLVYVQQQGPRSIGAIRDM